MNSIFHDKICFDVLVNVKSSKMSPFQTEYFNIFEQHIKIKMNTETNQWLQAEAEFHKWIENPELYPENPDTNFRKSIHIYFRRKYHNLLAPIIHWVFKRLPLDDFMKEEKEPEEIALETNFIREERAIRYRAPVNYEAENQRILSGLWLDNRQIIYEFYENEFSKVTWLILNNSGTIEDAKDVFQDALVILMDKFTWNKLDLVECRLGTYVYSISRNLWFEQLRKQKKENAFADLKRYDTVDISVDYYEEEPDMFELVSKAIDLLGDPCKQLLELFYFENHSWESIASIMSYSSAASARNQKYKCLERIKKQINIPS